MAGSILRERWSLKQWQPVMIHFFVDVGNRPGIAVLVFYFPAANKCIKKADGSERIRLGRFYGTGMRLFARNGSNTDPMTARRDLFIGKHQVPVMLNNKRIVVPISGDHFFICG